MSFRPAAKLASLLFACAACCALVFVGRVNAAEPDKATAEGLEFFEKKIRPVLVEHCYACHSAAAEELKGGLLLDSREGVQHGGDSGPVAVAGKPDESLLIEALKYESYEMPPSGQLPPQVIADFEQWVKLGLPDPRQGSVTRPRGQIDVEEGRKFWSFQPIARHEPPAVKDNDWPLTRIDRFLLAKLEEKGLTPASDADRATWLRRVTLDLIGLPPTPRQIKEFVADESPESYARVVDGLLASPHFGERWGRHWLDVARFAESSGGGRTLVFKDAWRYRDYVIQAFNRDKPLDRFIVEQIAGDLLPHATAAEESEQLIATGYLVLGAHNYEEQDKQALEMDVVDEQLDTIGRGLLGMTISCARCHDHKFDPIPTADYYALAGIFRSSNMLVHANVSSWTTRQLPVADESAAADIKAYETSLADAERALAEARKQPAGPEKKKAVAALQTKVIGLRKSGSPAPVAMAILEADKVEDTKICIRGSVRHRGPAVPRGVLQVATVGTAPQMPADESGRRELAEWITAESNPLASRVYVNRVWYCLFGVGLVRTPDNFGSTGETPSHPELLDDLALRFMQDGWSTKRLVRELVLSRAYRMSTADNRQAAAVDPENRLLWRMNRRRLDAETIRDSILTVSGKLDSRIGGPNIHDDRALKQERADMPTEYDYVFQDTRRSVYTPAFRNRVHELFEVFDFADQNGAVAKRNVTTVAPQALLMLNSAFVMEQSRAAAERALAQGKLSDEQRVELAFREALCRLPSREEREISLAAVANAGEGAAKTAAWEQLFQALFGCIDFRYVD